MENNIPTEAEEQITFVDWLETKKLKFTAIPNSTYTSSWFQKRNNTNLGLRPGLPDILVIVPGEEGVHHLLFIEMKRKKRSKTSEEQKAWIEALNMCPNVEARVCEGFDKAVAFVEEFLSSDAEGTV